MLLHSKVDTSTSSLSSSSSSSSSSLSDIPQSLRRLPPLTTIPIQAATAEYLFLAFRALSDDDTLSTMSPSSSSSTHPSNKTNNNSNNGANTNTNDSSSSASSSSSHVSPSPKGGGAGSKDGQGSARDGSGNNGLSGHYADGLHGGKLHHYSLLPIIYASSICPCYLI